MLPKSTGVSPRAAHLHEVGCFTYVHVYMYMCMHVAVSYMYICTRICVCMTHAFAKGSTPSRDRLCFVYTYAHMCMYMYMTHSFTKGSTLHEVGWFTYVHMHMYMCMHDPCCRFHVTTLVSTSGTRSRLWLRLRVPGYTLISHSTPKQPHHTTWATCPAHTVS